MGLRYVAPIIQEGKTIVKLEPEDIEEESTKWKLAIVLYVIGDSPSLGAVKRFLTIQWKLAEKTQIYYHNDDYFVIRFKSMEERYDILFLGPNTINNKPVIMKEWSADFNFQNKILKTIQIWIEFPNLSLSCWGGKSLSKFSSGRGTP